MHSLSPYIISSMHCHLDVVRCRGWTCAFHLRARATGCLDRSGPASRPQGTPSARAAAGNNFLCQLSLSTTAAAAAPLPGEWLSFRCINKSNATRGQAGYRQPSPHRTVVCNFTMGPHLGTRLHLKYVFISHKSFDFTSLFSIFFQPPPRFACRKVPSCFFFIWFTLHTLARTLVCGHRFGHRSKGARARMNQTNPSRNGASARPSPTVPRCKMLLRIFELPRE